MAYDLEEQESLAEIKAWWEKWGNLILTVVTVACLCAAGFQGWRWYQMKESTDAGVLYAQMIQASNMKDEARVQAIAGRLHESYASTTYAGMGALLAAHNAETAGKYAEAEKALKWIVESDKYPEKFRFMTVWATFILPKAMPLPLVKAGKTPCAMLL